jgi:hypothetical protein
MLLVKDSNIIPTRNLLHLEEYDEMMLVKRGVDKVCEPTWPCEERKGPQVSRPNGKDLINA